jgi:hypothetical protein
VIVLLHLDGHEAFKHLASAWDEHHLLAERHAIAESRSLTLYHLAVNAGFSEIDPDSKDAYAFEHVAHDLERVRAIAAPVQAAPGFRGASLFGDDDGRGCAILYRFTHADEVEAFRAGRDADRVLGPIGETGETFYPVHVVRTFV